MVGYADPAYQKESLVDLKAYAYVSRNQPVLIERRREGYSPCARCCCFLFCLLLAAIIAAAVLIAFLVRSPSVSLDHTQFDCPTPAVCIEAALDSVIPVTVFLRVNNPNIIGADVSSSNVVIFDQDATTVLATGMAPKQHVGANGNSIVQVDLLCQVTISNAIAVKNIFTTLFVNHLSYQIFVDAPIKIEFGALHPTVNFHEPEILLPQNL